MTPAVPGRPLPELASLINAGHAECVAAARTAIDRAIEVGRLLDEAKGQVRHGGWAGWVQANCSFGIREAQRYMQVFRNAGQFQPDPNATRATHLTSLRGALELLAEPKQEPDDVSRIGDHLVTGPRPPLDRYQAEQGTGCIRANLRESERLIEEMRVREGWKALGYESWESFLEGEGLDDLNPLPLDPGPLGRQEQQELARCEATIEAGLAELEGLGYSRPETGSMLVEVLKIIDSSDWPPGATAEDRIRHAATVAGIGRRIQDAATEQVLRADRALAKLIGEGDSLEGRSI